MAITDQTRPLTQQIQAVLAFSHEFAETHSLHHITPEILLLGLLEQDASIAVKVLATLNTPLDEIKTKITDSLPPIAAVRTENILLTPRSEQIMRLAFEEARRQNQKYIGIDHLLLALTTEGSGFPARLLAKEGVTSETVSRALEDFSEVIEITQQEESSVRAVNTEMTAIWRKLRSTERGGTPHIPLWLQYTLRGIFSFLFLLFVTLVLSQARLIEIIFPCLLMGAITFGVWQIGVPRKSRQLAQKFQQWDNPAIAGTLCDMLTWTDSVVRKEAMIGLTRLLPLTHTAELHQLYLSHDFLLARMLTPTMAKRETELVLAILGAFERIGAVKEKGAVRQLAATRDGSPQMQRVREAAQNCLATLELIEQQQTQKQTLLRASASASTENLLRASFSPTETKPDELLRPTEE